MFKFIIFFPYFSSWVLYFSELFTPSKKELVIVLFLYWLKLKYIGVIEFESISYWYFIELNMKEIDKLFFLLFWELLA